MPLLLGVGAGTGVGVGVGVGAGAEGSVPEVPVDPEVPVEPEEPELVVPVFEPPATGVVDEDETPDELVSEPVNCVVVVPGDLVRAFVPPHPVIQNAAILRAAMAQIPFRFNRIH